MRGIAFCRPGEAVPDDFPLWLERFEVGTVMWNVHHGDEAVYVLEGAVDVDGHGCPAGGAVIVEAGVPATLTAPVDASIVRMGTHEISARVGRRVHVVGPGGTWAKVDDERTTRYFADSGCATCDVTLFVTGRVHEHVSAPHSHSADELIHVLEGEIVVGRRHLGPGSTIAIAAGQRYGFRGEGFSFLNFRAHAATLTRDHVEIAEGPLAHGFEPIMDVR